MAVNREEWSSTTSSAVCSEHFDVGDFYLTESGLRRLSMDAIPTKNISVSFLHIKSVEFGHISLAVKWVYELR